VTERSPPRSRDGVVLPRGLSLDEAMRRYVEDALVICQGNKTEVAKRLSIGRNTVLRILQRK
jgi:DNA-binding NtrC family response regulator